MGQAVKAAVGAVLDLTAQGRSQARLNRRHDPALDAPCLAADTFHLDLP